MELFVDGTSDALTFEPRIAFVDPVAGQVVHERLFVGPLLAKEIGAGEEALLVHCCLQIVNVLANPAPCVVFAAGDS